MLFLGQRTGHLVKGPTCPPVWVLVDNLDHPQTKEEMAFLNLGHAEHGRPGLESLGIQPRPSGRSEVGG